MLDLIYKFELIGASLLALAKSIYYNVYINDLPDIPDHCSLESYVDDSKSHLTFPVNDINTATRQITEDLKKDFSRGAVKIAF